MTFSCAGEALAIVWTINQVNIVDLGIEDAHENVNGIRTSNTTFSGDIKFDNASIQCVLVVSIDTTNALPPVFLRVLGKN